MKPRPPHAEKRPCGGRTPQRGGSEESDVVRIALGIRPVGAGMGEDHGPALRPRLLGAGARPVRGARSRNGPRRHPVVARGEPRRAADASSGWRPPAGRGEGDPRRGRKGVQGVLPLPGGAAAEREDGAGRGTDPTVLRGPPWPVPADGAPCERDPAPARPRRGGRPGDRRQRERAGPGVGGAGTPAAAAPEDAIPPAGDGGRDPLLPSVRPTRPGDVRHDPVGPRRDPLQGEREGALPGDRPRLLPERPDGLLRAGGARLPEQRSEDGRARGGAGGGADPRRAFRPGRPEGGGAAPPPLPPRPDRRDPGPLPAGGRALRRRADGDRRGGDEPAVRPPPAAGPERPRGGPERPAAWPPLPVPGPDRPQRGRENRGAENAGAAHADGDGGAIGPRLPGFDRVGLPQPVRRGRGRAERGGGSLHLLGPHPAAERDPRGRGPRIAGPARRGRVGDGSSRGGGDRPCLPGNAGGPGGARGGDDALRGTERDRLHGSPVRERVDGVRRGAPSADVPAVPGGPRSFHGDGDRAFPRLSGRGSRAGEGVPLGPGPGPDGGDRPPREGARPGARRGGGARGEAQGGGGGGAAARYVACEDEGRGVEGGLRGAPEDAGGDPEGRRGARPGHGGDAEGPEDRHGAQSRIGDPRLEGEGARGGGGSGGADADEPVRPPSPRGGPLSREKGVRRVAVQGGGGGRAGGGRRPRGGGGRGRDEGPCPARPGPRLSPGGRGTGAPDRRGDAPGGGVAGGGAPADAGEHARPSRDVRRRRAPRDRRLPRPAVAGPGAPRLPDPRPRHRRAEDGGAAPPRGVPLREAVPSRPPRTGRRRRHDRPPRLTPEPVLLTRGTFSTPRGRGTGRRRD